jgi:hypothetical protein
MTRPRLLLVSVLLAVLPVAAHAGILFGKKPAKPSPNERVPELLMIVKTDGDEHKRVNAAEELRQYDPKQFPDIVPILIDVLLHDPKPSVRAEAAQSLSKLRPVSQQVGWALEQAVSKDPSMRVRLQARSALLQYHWAGYHAGKEPPLIQTQEPPLAPPAGKGQPVDLPSPRLVPKVPPLGGQAPMVPSVNTGGARPPALSGPPLIPIEPPRLQPLPATQSGPELDPQR